MRFDENQLPPPVYCYISSIFLLCWCKSASVFDMIKYWKKATIGPITIDLSQYGIVLYWDKENRQFCDKVIFYLLKYRNIIEIKMICQSVWKQRNISFALTLPFRGFQYKITSAWMLTDWIRHTSFTTSSMYDAVAPIHVW